MKIILTPLPKRRKAQRRLKQNFTAVILLTLAGIATCKAQNTFTATNVQVTNTITSSDGVFNNSVRISNFAGVGLSKLYVDANGTLQKGPPEPSGCIPGAVVPSWGWGGDIFTPFAVPGGLINDAEAGTCNNYDFILKSNGVKRQWLKTDGTIGFGTSLASNTGGPEYKFNAGALRLTSFNTYGGPQIVFDGGLNPFGDWGIEYLPSNITPVPGLNFWKPTGSPNSFNYLFFIGDDGRVGIGTSDLKSKLTVDGWNGDGIFVRSGNNSTKAISSYNVITNKENFIVYSNGKTRIGDKQPLGGGVHADAMLSVDGKILAKSVIVNIHNSVWPDYVFDKNYKLKSLTDVKTYIETERHLPGVPSAKELEEKGLSVSDMQVIQMEKTEELFLYNIQLKTEMDEMKIEIHELKKQNTELLKLLKNK